MQQRLGSGLLVTAQDGIAFCRAHIHRGVSTPLETELNAADACDRSFLTRFLHIEETVRPCSGVSIVTWLICLTTSSLKRYEPLFLNYFTCMPSRSCMR